MANNLVKQTPLQNPPPRPEVRTSVRELLSQAPAFKQLPPDKQRQIAHDTALVANYMAAPEGIEGHTLNTKPPTNNDPYSLSLANDAVPDIKDPTDKDNFQARAAREGAEVAGVLLTAVNFPEFVSGLITGVFQSIVDSSIKQMEAYGELVANVAKTLNQFRDENVSVNQGRDQLVDSFPDLFRLDVDTGDGGEVGPRVRLRDGVDEDEALKRVNTLPLERPVTNLDEETIDGELVQAARTQLATSRQQLLATMVMMGINRIIVTDGRISAKVMYNFQARDNFKYQQSATKFDYGDQYRYTGEGDFERKQEGAEYSYSKSGTGKDREIESDYTGASRYSKGTYKYDNAPVLKLAQAYTSAGDAALQTRASLAGQVDVNFKSETFPLERLADSFQIGRIQDAAQPEKNRQPIVTGSGSGATTDNNQSSSGS